MPERKKDIEVYAGRLAERLRHYREKGVHPLTISNVAEGLGISVQLYRRFEEKNAQPDIKMLNRMARFFKVSVDELLGLKYCENIYYSILDILEYAGIEYKRVSDTDDEDNPGALVYILTLPDGRRIELDYTQLWSCVLHAKETTDERIGKSLDSLFGTILKQIFWDAVGENLYDRVKYSDKVFIPVKVCPYKDFADRLRFFRKNKSVTQADLAQALNMSPQTYNRYEKNNARPSISLLISLASQLTDGSVNNLIGGYNPSLLDLALRYLKEAGISPVDDRSELDYTVLFQCPIGYDLTPETEEKSSDNKNINPVETVQLTGHQICFYLDYAWAAARDLALDDLDRIFKNTFRPLFFDLLQAPPPLKEEWQNKTYAKEIYLYWRKWDAEIDEDPRYVKTMLSKCLSNDEPDQDLI